MWMRLCMVHPDISQFPASHIILAPLLDSAKKPSLFGLRGDFGSAHLVDFPRCLPHCQSQRTLSWCNKDACCCHTYQSISTNIWAAGLPSSMAKMLPACGSPWKRPNSKSWRKAACSFTCGASIHLPTLTARHSVYKAMDKTTHRSLHPIPDELVDVNPTSSGTRLLWSKYQTRLSGASSQQGLCSSVHQSTLAALRFQRLQYRSSTKFNNSRARLHCDDLTAKAKDPEIQNTAEFSNYVMLRKSVNTLFDILKISWVSMMPGPSTSEVQAFLLTYCMKTSQHMRKVTRLPATFHPTSSLRDLDSRILSEILCKHLRIFGFLFIVGFLASKCRPKRCATCSHISTQHFQGLHYSNGLQVGNCLPVTSSDSRSLPRLPQLWGKLVNDQRHIAAQVPWWGRNICTFIYI